MKDTAQKPTHRTVKQVVAEAQAFFAEGIPEGVLVSEELIRERRAEAGSEPRFNSD